MAGLVRSASLTGYAEVARNSGLDPARMLSEFGLPQRCLRNPEVKVPIDAVRRLLEVSAERSGVESFGLLLAEARRLSNLGPLGLLIREQRTLRLAIDVFARYANRFNEALFLSVEETADVVVLREKLIAGAAGRIRQSTELAIGVAFRTLRSFMGPEWRPRRVCFAHDAPADRSVHQRIFGPSVEFGHDFNGIICARGDLERINESADPVVAKLARELLDSSIPATEALVDMTTKVRQLVVTLLGAGPCTIEVTAQHLGIDRRTVHRHLAREGQTFSAIVDAVRRDLVERYIGDVRRSLAEISSLLGFSAPSGFSRWYRHQFKACPSEQRTAGVRRKP